MAFIPGTPNSDNLPGTFEDDTILGLAGDDMLDGANGDDATYGGAGDDSVNGESSMTLFGARASDWYVRNWRSQRPGDDQEVRQRDQGRRGAGGRGSGKGAALIPGSMRV